MPISDEFVACRSVSPVIVEGMNGFPCEKPRGHKKMHVNRQAEKRWQGGINTPAQWEYKDDGYMS